MARKYYVNRCDIALKSKLSLLNYKSTANHCRFQTILGDGKAKRAENVGVKES